MSETSLPIGPLKVKYDSLSRDIARLEGELRTIREHRDHLHYLITNYAEIFEAPDKVQGELFPQESLVYSPKLDTESLILKILENENREMKWQEVFEIFKGVKPHIAESTFRVQLSKMNTGNQYPVSLRRDGSEYLYFINHEKELMN